VFAKNKGLVSANPVTETMLPKGKPPRETHAYSLEAIKTLLNNLSDSARCAVALAGFAGLRSGEIAGLEWQDIGDEIAVTRSVWCSTVNDRTKTEASRTTVPIDPGTP
jgi:integrase